MDVVRHFLPTQGLYCAAQLTTSGGFVHRFFDAVEPLVNYLESQDRAGQTMYLAQASYKTTTSRKTDNAAFVRNFFFDVDCGAEKFAATPDKAYPTQQDGCQAIKDFAAVLDLPLPTVVNSGNGLYAKWLIDEDIPAPQWKSVATILKNVARAAGFRQDPSRTSDTSSVLRPVGTHNRKNGVTKPVRLLHLSQPLSFDTFTKKLEAAAKKLKVHALPLQPPTQFKGLNDEFMTGDDGPPSSLLAVADKCLQVGAVRDSLGNVDEPTWYNFLGLGRYTTEGKEVVILHEWSKGHPDYSPEVTFKKIQQHEAGGFGPTTCQKFGADNPSGCVGCKHTNKIKSPIVLGRPEPVALVPDEPLPEEQEVLTPTGYRRSKEGLFWDDDGRWQKFYPYDLYLEQVAEDRSLGYEVFTVKHEYPNEGYMHFSLRSALLHDPKAFLMALSDNHVQVPPGDSRKHMIGYVDATMAMIRDRRKLATLHNQFGWQSERNVETDNKVFVLGNKIYRKGKEPMETGFARNVPEAAKAFAAQGSLAEWTATTKYLGLPGMEPFAFAFLAGAFGAPLLKFTGYAGAMVALIGESGIGKTLLGEWIMSVYGESQRLILLKDDTRNFLVQRLGLYGSLPLYVDEISNIEGQDLSDLVYKITQGRDKGRLSRSGKERDFINQWNTIAIASSNHSLTDKLAVLKADASAEMNRVMEIEVDAVAGFGRDEATAVYHAFHANYGEAGQEFVKYIVAHQDEHRDKIDTLVRSIDTHTRAQADERFWSAISGAAIYGGLIAKHLGLIEFEIAPMLAWVKTHIISARRTKSESVSNYSDLLGQFLDLYSSCGMVATNNAKGQMPNVIREPRGQLVYRINEDTKRLLISRSALKAFLEKNFGSYTKLRKTLTNQGALISADKRRVLGAGTYFSGAQQAVWEIDLNCPDLGHKTLGLVKRLEDARKVVTG